MLSQLTVNLDQERLDDIVPDNFKVGVTNPVGDLICQHVTWLRGKL